MSQIKIPVAVGELIDKISILSIKSEKLNEAEKLKNVTYELKILKEIKKNHLPSNEKLDELALQLKVVNSQLWEIEDEIREFERSKDFGEKFIELARAVYFTNDKRAMLKKKIDVLLGSDVTEEKSYSSY